MVIPVVEEPQIIEISSSEQSSSSSSSSSSSNSEDSSDDSTDDEVVVIIEPVIPNIPVEIWEVQIEVWEIEIPNDMDVAVEFAVEDFPGDNDWISDYSDIEYADSV